MIEHVLSRYVNVKRVGLSDISFKCPSCGKGKNHFQVSLRKPVAHCFKCGFSADWITIVRLVAGVGTIKAQELLDREDAMGHWRTAYHDKTQQMPPVQMPPVATSQSLRSMTYLANRGILKKTADAFGLYYCDEGIYHGRIIIPINYCGKTVGFQGRAIAPTMKLKRYLFPHGISTGEMLLNYDNIPKGERVVVVEGPFDCMAVHQAGFNCVATFGKQISHGQLLRLEELEPSSVVLFYDADANVDKAFQMLNHWFTVRVATLFDGDPAECNDINHYIKTAGTLRDHQYKQMRHQLSK